MGIQKSRICLSFDAATVTIIDRCVARYTPLFDDNRSLAVRFMLKQYDKFMEAVPSPETLESALARLQLLNPINPSYAPKPLQAAAIPSSFFPKFSFPAQVSPRAGEKGVASGIAAPSHIEFEELLKRVAGVN